MKIAVATIDIIDSSHFQTGELERVMDRLKEEILSLEKSERIIYFEVFRGDSMQMIIRNPQDALEIGFILRSSVNSFNIDNSIKRGIKIVRDIRIAIGIGESQQKHFDKMTNEPPFVRSGKKLDQIHEEGLGMGISSGHKQVDREFQTELYLYEGIHKRWTLPVAEVVYHKLKGKTEQVIADELNISQSAVNQRSHSAYWNGLSALLGRYQELIAEM